jgi:hypothetical protein
VLGRAGNPLSAELNHVVATMNDLMLTQFETTTVGMRSLCDALLKDCRERTVTTVTRATLESEQQITEEPLPV